MTRPLDAPERESGTVDLFADEADRMLEVLASETARTILAELGDEPGTTSDLAGRVDTSLQNASYHLGRLTEAGLVEVVGVHYSARGREMDVFGPTHDPLVIVGGEAPAARPGHERDRPHDPREPGA